MSELGLPDDFRSSRTHRLTRSAARSDARSSLHRFQPPAERCKFIALMPQWDFSISSPSTANALRISICACATEAVDLIEEGGRVTRRAGGDARRPEEVRADLVVACDGRHSTLRACAGMKVEDLGAPMDVLWFRIPASCQTIRPSRWAGSSRAQYS